MRVAYGWKPDSDWGTNPLWQANLTEGQTLKNASYHYLISDHLGTPQLAINSTGEQSWKINSDAFGNSELDANNQITMNLRFPGQYYDAETGLSYNYFRDYDAKTGRYIQSDPIGLAGGINTYGYVGGNPLVYSDPTGEIAQIMVPVAVAAAFVAAACILTPACNKSLPNVQFPNVGSGTFGGVDELPYLNSWHQGEEKLLIRCEKNWGLGHNPFDPNDRCQKLRNAIFYLSMRVRIRAGQLMEHQGGDWGHNKRYNRVLNALKKLVAEAQLWGCEYDPQADEILKSSKQKIAKEMKVPKDIAKKYN
jgi:RHS repeat-associated protein